MAKTVSLLPGGTNSHAETAAAFNAVATDFIANGVVGSLTNTAGAAPMTGGYAVNAQGTPNATTQVSAGKAYVTAIPTGSTSQTFRCYDDTGATINHAANASGSTRYDWIYIELTPADLTNPSADGSSPFTYTVSRSTSSASDNGTPPTYGYCIAVVALANGFVTITNGNITDKRVQSGANSIVNNIATTPKIKPTTFYITGNNGGSRQTITPASGWVDVTGMSLTYNSGNTNEKLYITWTGTASNGAGGNVQFSILVNATRLTPYTYHDGAGANFQTHSATIPFDATANATYTIKLQAQAGTVNATIANQSSDVAAGLAPLLHGFAVSNA